MPRPRGKTRTMKLYSRPTGEISFDEGERILICKGSSLKGQANSIIITDQQAVAGQFLQKS